MENQKIIHGTDSGRILHLRLRMARAGIAIILMMAASCGRKDFTAREKAVILESGEVMKVMTVGHPEELKILRSKSMELDIKELRGSTFAALAEKMINTVKDPSQDGVGIAAPQVGINRRVVAVQRFDKEGYPFEIYPNISLEPVGTDTAIGDEGCLSIPDHTGKVKRYTSVIISYTDPETLRRVSETISGFTSVIFQHECDHLNGILYTDREEQQD